MSVVVPFYNQNFEERENKTQKSNQEKIQKLTIEIAQLQAQIALRVADIQGLKHQYHVNIQKQLKTTLFECDTCLLNEQKWALEKQAYEQELTQKEEEIKKLESYAYIDELTGAFNRRKFNQVYIESLKKARNEPNRKYTLALLDIDHFKQINDQFGHPFGDEVLKKMRLIIQTYLDSLKVSKKTIALFRYGGEEFAIMTTRNQAFLEQILNHLLNYLKNNTIQIQNIHTKVSFSAGISQFTPEIGNNTNDKALLEQADQRLYFAKQNGRSQVCSTHK